MPLCEICLSFYLDNLIMKRRSIFLLFFPTSIALLLLFLNAGKKAPDYSIRLRWIKAYDDENWTKVKTGLYWSLSFLGAKLDTAQEKKLLHREDSTTFSLHLDHAGFSKPALQAISTLLDSLRASGEYDQKKAIDLGRFIVVLQHISPHYYAITGVAPTLDGFKKRHHYANALSYAVMKSAVAKHHRVLRFCGGRTINDWAFIAEEGTGSPDSGNFVVRAYETFDVMENGQLRFAIYDANGNLTEASPMDLGHAGKPGKCLWCHESSVQPLYFETPDLNGYITANIFTGWMDSAQHVIDRHRKTLHSLIDYSHKQDHTFSELLYISFMEPSARRIAAEWGTTTDSVLKKLNNLPQHPYEEFLFLGNLYDRHAIDSAALYRSALVPRAVREAYGKEPSYLK